MEIVQKFICFLQFDFDLDVRSQVNRSSTKCDTECYHTSIKRMREITVENAKIISSYGGPNAFVEIEGSNYSAVKELRDKCIKIIQSYKGHQIHE